MSILFIADLHLQERKPVIITGFLRFLRDKALTANTLYILGDLFDTWIGDDDPKLLHREMGNAIKDLVDYGVPCYFIHGNRDFLIGKKFAKASSMILLPEEQVIDIYGYRLLIMHGDTLCTDDVKYQLFRTRVHNPWIKKLFLSLPIFVRSRIVASILAFCKALKHKKSLPILEVNPKTVIKVMEKYQVQWLICGHTHRPNMYKLIANGLPACCIVLGAWNNGRGSMVKVTPERIELLDFPL